MKITFLDIYRKSKYKISKNTNAGMGTANNYGTNFIAKIQNILIKKAIHYPPQNCLYSMAVLAEFKHEVEYSDELITNNSDIYVLTSSIVNHETEVETIRKLRKFTSSLIIVIGPFAECVPENYLNADETNNTKIIIGEPEGFFLKNNDHLSIDYLKKLPNKIIFTELINLDLMPFPAWNLVFKSSNNSAMKFLGKSNSVTIEGSRGCPYSCAYYCCYPNIQGNKLRFRDPKKIVEEMLYQKKYLKASNFTFRDPVFTISKKHVNSILEEIIKTNEKFNICIETQLKDIDLQMLLLMKKAGVKLIYVGVESSEKEVLDSAKRKNLENEKIFKLVNQIERMGIMVKCNYILCLPGDNYTTAKKTIKFAKKINSSFAQFTVFTPMPKTPAWLGYLAKLNYKKFEQFTMWDLVINHDKITALQTEKLKNQAAYYYLGLKYIFTRLPRVVRNFLSS